MTLRVPFLRLCVGILSLGSVAQADLSYKVTCELGKAPMQELSSMAPGGDLLADCNQEYFRKGKLELSRGKRTSTLMDYGKGTQTLLDAKAKTWSRSSIAEVENLLQEARSEASEGAKPPQFKLGKAVEPRRIASVMAQGLTGELRMEIPTSHVPNGPTMTLRMEIEVWSSMELPGAVENQKWEEELKQTGNASVRQLEALLGGMPGSEELMQAQQSMKGLPVEIRLITRIQSPEKAQLGESKLDPLGIAAALDRGAVLMDMTMRFSGHNTAEIPASLFEIPAAYSQVQ